ncbi:MAG: acetyltransferase [Saprospiraceae bacterium]|nr:acetyltransferase [Saprospiraceae bacterium]
MNKKIALIGAGGHTRSLISLINKTSFKIDGIYDDNFNPDISEFINGCLVSGKLIDLPENSTIILSIGNNELRKKLYSKFKKNILKENIIHPNSTIEKYVFIGNSNQIFASVYINSQTRIGNNNIINTGVILEHENEIGDHNHISIGSILGGRVSIGSSCFIGAGVTIIDNISICSNVIVGAGSVIIKDIIDPGTYVGNPTHKIK